jgi:hypothetical protein
MPRLRILLWWDTEDYINTESDKALRLLLEAHRAREMPAVWKLVGEKSRALEARERQDIIDLLRDPLFEVGYHTDFHSAHPTIGEYTEGLAWQDGVAAILTRETKGLDDTLRIVGKPLICYGQPGASYTPHAYGAMEAWGIPAYLGDSVYLGLNDRPCYVAGKLSIVWMEKAHARFPARRGDEALTTARQDIREHLDNPPAGALISQGGHPNEWSLAEWWDEVNFAGGKSPSREQWRSARTHSDAQLAHLVERYGQYLDWLREIGVEPISLREIFGRYTPGDYWLDADSAREAAVQWAEGEITYYQDLERGKSFSPAQIMVGLASLFVRDKRYTAVPEIEPPLHDVESEAITGPLPFSVIEAASKALLAHAHASGSLPSVVQLDSRRIALADLAQCIALAWLGRPQRQPHARLLPAEQLRVYGRDVGPWSIHRPDFTGESLRRLTALLAWTLKPALLTN